MKAKDPKKTATAKMWELQVLEGHGSVRNAMNVEHAVNDENIDIKDAQIRGNDVKHAETQN